MIELFRQFSLRDMVTNYGELETFLSGLELDHQIELFRKNHVTFQTFLRMTDSDLQQVNTELQETSTVRP